MTPLLGTRGCEGAWPALAALVLLAGCHRGAPDPAASPTPQGLEAAAIQAGVIADPASTDLTGVYATENDRICIVPSAKAYRIGVFVDYDETQNCGVSGVVTRDGDTLHVTLGTGAGAGCSLDARFEGDRIVFPPRVPDRCQQACRGRASIAALDVTRLSESAAEAATLRDTRGRLLCGDGG
ncbi:hypothetical protein [Sphingomonas sp. PAMC 26605]|uniref:hypothetical protein n=1 Tax=Sphingomonas sp. PAMC 26605 TaxID=1112214 RepID=UPI00026CAC84|nr:hypothetical protein [Sphingomonas sp. PAMC 26605]